MWVYFHNIDPFALHFWGNIGIRWYSLAYIAGLIFGWLFILQLIKRSRSPLSKDDLSTYINYIIIGTLIGGRFGYCAIYQPSLLIQLNFDFPFWGALAIHKGGMASHGGILGIVIASWIFSRKYTFSFFHILDLTVVGGCFGIICGRIANFINSELYGRVIEGKNWFGVQFPKEIYFWYNQSNIDKERLLSLKNVVSQLGTIKNPFGSQDISLSEILWVSWVNGGRKFAAEILSVLNHINNAVEKGQKEIILALGKVLPIRHPSQIYQAVLEGLVPLLIVLTLWWKPKKAGLISGVWGLSYLIMRTTGEQFRMPDTHIGFDALGLTRGQWLSVFSIIPVCIYIYFVYKNKDSRVY